jgi:two-component system, NarL family, nitrate/nitrite response regulator NarL
MLTASGPTTLRVLIVSDVRVVQEGLKSVLAQAGVDVVSTVDMLQATAEIARLQPHLVLFDAARQDSVEFAKVLVASAPYSKIVAFGVKETAEEFLALAAAGTAGYVRDSAPSSDVVKVLEQVMRNELSCSPRAAASLYRRVATLSQQGADKVATGNANGNGGGNGSGGESGGAGAMPLSPRELQIGLLIDRGLTNKEIGRQLGIEAATVKNHVHNMCEKLNVHRRGEAAARIRAIARIRASLLPAAPDAGPAADFS